ncbi:MAG: hypothetical protein SPI59_04980 [Finegoldia sp.]|nr:hypothetical protein [Finegoldia sp.]
MANRFIREFDSERQEVFKLIEKRIFEKSIREDEENNYSISRGGVNISYTIKEYVPNERIKADLFSKNVSGAVDILFKDREGGGSLVDIDLDLKSSSAIGGLFGFLISKEKIVNRFAYEVKRELGEL